MSSFTLEALPASVEFLWTMLNSDENLTYEKLKVQVEDQEQALAVKNMARKCFKCKSTDHIAKDCNKPMLPCQFCGKRNHPSFRCFKKNEAQQLAVAATEQEAYVFMIMNEDNSRPGTTTDQWIVDTGATHSMTGNRNMFVTLEDAPKCVVRGVVKIPLISTQRGTVELHLTTSVGKTISLKIKDVHYVPQQDFKLISLKIFIDQYPKSAFEFGGKSAQLLMGSKTASD